MVLDVLENGSPNGLKPTTNGDSATKRDLMSSMATTTDGLAPARTLRDVALDAEAKVAAFLAEAPDTQLLRNVQDQVRISIRVIHEALDRYGSFDELSVSYNGGKDCLVLLVLILACLPQHFSDEAAPVAPPSAVQSSTPNPSSPAAEVPIPNTNASTPTHHKNHPPPATQSPPPALPPPPPPHRAHGPFPPLLHAVYIESAHPFPEVDAFVAASAAAYRLDLARSALPMRPALAAYLGARPAVRAVFVGTRRTDPHGERLTHFDRTDVDKGWPDFVRVHPVIDWHYAEIWGFIRHLGIPYCSLYDRGYTSLGGTTDTHPNPALKKEKMTNNETERGEGREAHDDGDDDGDEPGFRPAYELMDDYEERLGRDR